MISILLDAVAIGFDEATSPAGQKLQIMVVTDQQSGITVRLPLEPEAARAISAHLDGRPPLHIAHTLPPS